MSNASSNAAEWYSLLNPVAPPTDLIRRPDDPRMWEVIEFWQGDPAALRPGRPVIIGFPQDEGVRRNGGRVGAAEAPRAIRSALWRLVSTDAFLGEECDFQLRPNSPLDIGDVRIPETLEESQEALGRIVANVLRANSVPVILGGGHETTFGHYLGYVYAYRNVGIINLDAHLDVRPLIDGRGHSGSPFRQMMEHSERPLPGTRYVCLGLQPQATSAEHLRYARERRCVIETAAKLEAPGAWEQIFARQFKRFRGANCSILFSIDADVAHERDVPGVSAPNPMGVPGADVTSAAAIAGTWRGVSSIDLVEINPRFDPDGQSARWAALAIWNFLTRRTPLAVNEPETAPPSPPAGKRKSR